jgi:diguanylate cyclase
MIMSLNAEELDVLIQQQLADPAYRDSPLYASLQALWSNQLRQITQLEQVCHRSDASRESLCEHALSLDQRFERQLQQFRKIIRISDHYQKMMRDLTVRLKIMASRDPLTGLHNRGEAEQVLEREWRRSKRYGIPLTILMFDVDSFKQINDRFGHAYGDTVLKMIAKAVQVNLRTADTLARWGGEEFLIVAQHTDMAGGAILAEKIRHYVALQPMANLGHVTISLGVAQFSGDESLDQLLRRGDQAMYRAKNSGRNCVVTAEEHGDHEHPGETGQHVVQALAVK